MIAILITAVVGLFILGVLLWGVSAFPWISSDIKQVIHIICVVIFVIWLLGLVAGLVPSVHYFR